MKVQGRDHDHKIVLGETIAAKLRKTGAASAGHTAILFRSTLAQKATATSPARPCKSIRVTLALEGKHTPQTNGRVLDPVA